MLFLVATLATAVAAAQSADKGYVVRADSATVWLDLTAADGAADGRAFEIYTEGAELTHPVTGARLGRVQNVIATGQIKDVADKFSTGEVSWSKEPVKTGQRARLPAPAAPPAPTRAASRPGEPEERAPKMQGAPVPYEANAMAIGSFSPGAGPQIVLASENAIWLYPYPMADAKPLAEETISGTGLRVLGLEAFRRDGVDRDDLLVSVYDDAFRRFETRVMSLQDGRWSQTADLPFLTRTYQDAAGKRAFATQQILDDKSFPFGALYPLAYRDGKYVQGRPALHLRRVDWLYGFTTAPLNDKEPAVLLLTATHRLRVQLGKASWPTPDDDYGQTPVRVRWQDRLLEFNPPIVAIYGPSGFDALYAVRNIPALGGLASPFGIFNRGELVSQRWNGLGLQVNWKADLSGCAQGLAVVEPAPGRKELAVAVRGSTGQSSVWIFDL